MPYEVINNKRSKSVIRVVGNTATNVTLAQAYIHQQMVLGEFIVAIAPQVFLS